MPSGDRGDLKPSSWLYVNLVWLGPPAFTTEISFSPARWELKTILVPAGVGGAGVGNQGENSNIWSSVTPLGVVIDILYMPGVSGSANRFSLMGRISPAGHLSRAQGNLCHVLAMVNADGQLEE